jgi:hypothetical protein
MFIGISPASGNLPSGKRGILRRFPGKAAGYSCSNGRDGCLGIPDTMITLILVRVGAHPPEWIAVTCWVDSLRIARRPLAAGAAYVPQISHLVRARCSAGISRLAFEAWLLALIFHRG